MLNFCMKYARGCRQALVKKFTKHSLKDATGPVTVVSGKKRRLTFLECQNDLSSMIVRMFA